MKTFKSQKKKKNNKLIVSLFFMFLNPQEYLFWNI